MVMLDFAALPPEVNSTRMYTGPGSGPMMAAATAWDAAGAQWESFVARYLTELASLEGLFWSGPAAVAMAAAVAPFVAWANGIAVHVEQVASQARVAAAAYEAAHAATVPPAAVAANRALLATLVATNFVGQNTPAIAATEALYSEMWAQDAAAMYSYAGSALPATAILKPVAAPPQVTTPGAQSNPTAQKTDPLAQVMSAVPQHGISTGSSSTHAAVSSGSNSAVSTATAGSPTATTGSSASSQYYYITNWQTFEKFYNIFNTAINKNFYNGGVTLGDQLDYNVTIPKWFSHMTMPRTPPFLYAGEADALSFLGGNGTTLAGTGKAASVGTLSVPRSWASASSPGQSVGVADDVSGSQSTETARGVLANSATPTPYQPPSLGPMGSPGQRDTSNAVLRMRDRRFRMPRPAVGG